MTTIQISEKLALKTQEWNPDERRSFEQLRYQYAVTLNFVIIIGLALIGGMITGHVSATMTAAAAFMLLRMFSGGFHFRSLDVCAIVTAAIFVAIPLVPLAGAIIPAMTAAAFVIVAWRAPTNLRNTAWAESERIVVVKRVYKFVALAIVAANFYVGSAEVALAFGVQALLLIPRREVNPI